MSALIPTLVARFAAIDAEVDALVASTGLACPPGCGACCLSPEVEAAPEELAYWADEWVRRGSAEATLARLSALESAGSSTCVLYEPSSSDGRSGRCGAYAWRPLICRLFGFAARTNRLEQKELVVCKTMAAASPARTQAAATAVQAGSPAPDFATHAHGLIADLGGLGGTRLPINQALKQALHKRLLKQQLSDAAAAGDPE
jgi:uncharacterized protein